jgi:streptogramin lyase
MKHTARLVALVIVLTASAYEPTALPTATVHGAGPLFAAAGPAGHFKSFRVPTDGSEPRHITLGSDGNMWFTESNIDVSQIGRIDAGGNITEFVVPTRFSQPSDIVSGPDGALWFTAPSGFPDFFIGTVTTDGRFAGFAPECDPQLGCSIVPQGITSGPDGNLWFTERIRNAIVRLTPLGEFTFHTIPTLDANLRASRQVRMERSGLRSSTATGSAGSMFLATSPNLAESLGVPIELRRVRTGICGSPSPSRSITRSAASPL